MNTEEQNQFPEAGAVCYFGYKRSDGFEVSFTLRDKTGSMLMKRLEGAIAEIKKAGGTPLPLKGGFSRPEKKPQDFVEGRVCPLDGGRLVKAVTKQGKKLIKCENNKWDFAQKKAVGCQFTEWEQQVGSEVPVRDISEY